MKALPVLQLQQLEIQLGSTTILEALDLEVHAGECVALFGASGCGKTSVLRVIAGLIEQAGGEMQCHARLAYLFQEPRLLPWLSAWENIRLICPDVAQEDLEALWQDLGLSHRDGDKYPHECSGGMQQRIALARAWLSGAALWLLDEPFSALDARLRAAMQKRLQRQIEQGKALVLVTHDAEEALLLAQRIYFLDGKPTRLRKVLHLRESYAERDALWLRQQMQQEALFQIATEWEA